LAAFALVVEQHELDVARDDFLPDGGADLVVSDARREVFHRVSDDRSDAERSSVMIIIVLPPIRLLAQIPADHRLLPAHGVQARAFVKLVLEGIAAPCHVIESYRCGEFATLDHGDAGMITTINDPHSKINSEPKQFRFVWAAYSSLAARAKPSTPLSPMVLTRPAVLARMTKQPAISLAQTRCCVSASL